jgi:hypothetical protein
VSFLSINDRQRREVEQQSLLIEPSQEAFEPDWFEGVPAGIGTGVARAVGVANQLAGAVEYQVGRAFTEPLDMVFDTKATEALRRITIEEPAKFTAAQTPDPLTVGAAGRVLYSVVGVGAPAIAAGIVGGPAAAAAAAGGFQMTGTMTDLMQQGVDERTAIGAATIDGALTTVGVAIPAAIGGRVALNTLLYGPGVNVAQDIVASKGIGAYLKSQGYDELAERYSELQSEQLAADVILGAAFGYLGARSARINSVVSQREIQRGLTPDEAADSVLPMQPMGPAYKPLEVPRQADSYDELAARIYDELRESKKQDIDLNDVGQIRKFLGDPKVESLAQFIKRTGGIIDDGGELSSRDITNKTMPGLVRKDTPDNRRVAGWDGVRERIFDAGYFPEKNDYNEITDSEIVDALESDLFRDKVYNGKVREKLEVIRQSRFFNDSMSYEGITPDMTPAQIADRLRMIDDEARANDERAVGPDEEMIREYDQFAESMDAAMVTRNRANLELDTAPGIPANRAALMTHLARMKVAVEQMLRGEPVSVDNVGKGGTFAPRPKINIDEAEIIKALRESGLPGVLDEIDMLEAELAGRGRDFEGRAIDMADIDRPRGEMMRIGDEGFPADMEVAGDDGMVTVRDGMRDSEDAIRRAEQEYLGFPAAVNCALRHGE